MGATKGDQPTSVVIGGGVIGLSIAYHLALKQFGRIIVIEKDQVGSGSSSRAGGIITGLLWTKTGVEARKISLRRYRELSDELGAYGYRFHDAGCLNLFDESSWSDREKLLPLYQELNVTHEIIDAAEIRYRWPELHVNENVIGLFDPLGGYSEPHQYIPALMQKCKDLGVEIHEGQMVTEVRIENGRVIGVQTGSGVIRADVVISSVHTWTRLLLEQHGYILPMKTFIHQRYTTTPLDVPVSIPAVNANPYGGYLRPADGQRILVGGETLTREEFMTPDLVFKMSALSAPDGYGETLHGRIVPLMPRLREASWETEMVGLLSFSMDGEPILGAIQGADGLFVAASFHSGGFAYNPVAGLLMAELVADGETQIDIVAFSPSRFNTEEAQAYLAQNVTQEHAVYRRH